MNVDIVKMIIVMEKDILLNPQSNSSPKYLDKDFNN